MNSPRLLTRTGLDHEPAYITSPSKCWSSQLWLHSQPRVQRPHAAFLQEVGHRTAPPGKRGAQWLTMSTRLFKFPQMDFEMAIWEMTSLLIAPKKVFKSIYYHVSWHPRRSVQPLLS